MHSSRWLWHRSSAQGSWSKVTRWVIIFPSGTLPSGDHPEPPAEVFHGTGPFQVMAVLDVFAVQMEGIHPVVMVFQLNLYIHTGHPAILPQQLHGGSGKRPAPPSGPGRVHMQARSISPTSLRTCPMISSALYWERLYTCRAPSSSAISRRFWQKSTEHTTAPWAAAQLAAVRPSGPAPTISTRSPGVSSAQAMVLV